MAHQRIVLIDLGVGNLHSVARSLERVAERATITISRDAAVMAQAHRLVIPGQGAFAHASLKALEPEMQEALNRARERIPILGICIGMQLMLASSEEAPQCAGLHWIPGRNLKFQADESHKVPHVGWNRITIRSAHPLWHTLEQDLFFYFVHSYYVAADNPFAIAHCHYTTAFSCALAQDNLAGVVFHPEKSSATGLRLLHNFCRWKP